MIQTKVAKKNQNTYFMFSFENFAVCGIMWKKYCTFRQATDDSSSYNEEWFR